jgi:hypothetical protein
MAYPLVVSPEAEAELARGREWYGEQSAGLGTEFVNCVDEVFTRIQRAPLAFAEAYKNVRQTLAQVPQYSPNAPHFSGRQVESRHYI